MAYPYGTQGAPAVGTGAPGLPQRASSVGADPAGAPLQRIIVRATDLYASNPLLTPDWSTYCRVTTLGKGGQGRGGLYGGTVGGTGAHGGGGAGIAATLIEPTPSGTPIAITFAPNATLASFLNYQLSAGNGGDATLTAGGAPGVGSGGAINFNGGAGETTTASSINGGGGGAAGRGGNGTAGGAQQTNFGGNGGLGDPYATGGGAGGAGAASNASASIGGLVRTSASLFGAVIIGASTAPGTYNSSFAATADGGDGGGGSGGSTGTASNAPGLGLVLIELW